MAVETTANRISYSGNGSTTVFSFPYKFLANGDLRVYIRVNSTAVETLKTLTTHYTVSGAGVDAGGTVTMLTAPASGETLIIYNDPAATQGVDLRENDSSPAEAQEGALDRLTILVQRLKDRMDRALRLTDAFSPSFTMTFPSNINEAADKVPLINATGDGFADADEWPTADEISGAQTSATAAAASASAASGSAAAALVSENNAAASEASAQAAAQSVIWRDVVFITNANSPYTIDSTHRGKLIAADCTSGAISITLPQISGLDLSSAYVVAIKKTDSSANTITINRAGTDTIDGATSKTILAPDSGATFIPDTDTSPDEWTTADFGLNAGNYTIDRFSGNGSTTGFTLSVGPGTENNTMVYISGVYQQKDTYSLSGTTLTFSVAPPSGTDNIEVVSGVTIAIGVPSDGTVTTQKLDSEVIHDMTAVTPVAADHVAIADASDSNAYKKALVSHLRNAVYRSVTTTDSVGVDDETMVLSGASFTATLPTAVSVAGKRYKFIHGGTSHTQIYTLATTSAQTIGGIASGSYALYTNGEVLEIESDGTNWIIVNHLAVTDWVSYTPNSTQGFGTIASVTMYRRRVGCNMEIRGRFTTGTTTASEARVDFYASGETINSTSAISTIEIAGQYGTGVNGAYGAYSLMEASVGYITFGQQGSASNPTSKLNGSTMITTGQVLMIRAIVPIANWRP